MISFMTRWCRRRCGCTRASAYMPRDRVLEHVAVAAEELQAVVDHLALQVGQVHHLAIEAVAVSSAPSHQRSMQRSTKMRATTASVLHLGQLEAGVLQLDQRLAEGLRSRAYSSVSRSARSMPPPRRRRSACARRAAPCISWKSPCLRRRRARSRPGRARRRRRARRCPVPSGPTFSRMRPTRKPCDVARLDHQQRDAAGAGRGVGLGDHHDQVREVAVRDEGLRAVDHVVVAVAHGAGADALQVGAGAGLRHRDGADHLAAGELRQVARFCSSVPWFSR